MREDILAALIQPPALNLSLVADAFVAAIDAAHTNNRRAGYDAALAILAQAGVVAHEQPAASGLAEDSIYPVE